MKDDGGPAFASGEWQETRYGDRLYVGDAGMTLLDYFAGQALIACADDFIKSAMPRSSMAREAYDIAAAMLAEKRRRQ